MQRYRLPALVVLLYSCALLQFVRFYVASTSFYLNMPAYLAGRERLPFQERVFPILFLKPLTDSTWVQAHLVHSNGVFTAQRGPFYVLSLTALFVAAIYTQRLYDLISSQRMLRVLVFPTFLFAVIWTYTIHSEANFSYPYDLPSLAFFTAGLFYIYRHQYLPLLVIVLVGSFNRETTLFLIGLYLLDALSPQDLAADSHSWSMQLRRLPWARAALLSIVWVTIKVFLARHFAENDASETFLRARDNLHQLSYRLVPALLNVCGYLLPLVLVFNRLLTPRRFRLYLWILVPWMVIMFFSGILVETRIYGELCSYSAVALVLILENYIATRAGYGTPEADQPIAATAVNEPQLVRVA